MAVTMSEASSSRSNAYVSTTSATSGLSINLHPLPLLNISEHANRSRISPPSDTSDRKLIGALLGTQTNRDVSILNTFQIIFDRPEMSEGDFSMDIDPTRQGAKFEDSRWMVDLAFLEERKKQFKEVFPTQEVVGWYSVGSQPDSYDMLIHAQLSETMDNPIFLLFDNDAQSGQDLPVTIYESALDNAETDQGGMGKFVQLSYGVETGEAERIAVDGVSRGGAGEDDEYSVVGNLTTQRNAIRMLHDRMQVISGYIDAVSKDKVQADHTILRQIASLVATLPTIDAPDFQKELHTEIQDVQITAYLSSLTKQLDALVNYSDRHHVTHPSTRDDDYTPTQRGFKTFGKKK